MAAIEEGLVLVSDDTKIISGHGPVAGLANLLAYSDTISNVEVAMQAGKSHNEIRALRPVDGYNMNSEGFVTPDRFVEMVYAFFWAVNRERCCDG